MISARYPINPQTGMPSPNPQEILLKYRRKPNGAVLVPIEYVAIPFDDISKLDDPKLYDRITPNNSRPTILVNAPELPYDFPADKIRVNNYQCLFVNGTPFGPKGAVVVHTPAHSKSKKVLQPAFLIALPLTLVVDIVTLPLQAIVLGSLYKLSKDLRF